MKARKQMPESVKNALREILPILERLTADEVAWVTSACLRYLCMKIEAAE